MNFFSKEKKPEPESREYEGTVKRVGLLESYDAGSDYYVMLLEGGAEPIHLKVSRNVAFALTGPGDFVRFRLVDLYRGPVLNLESFQNFTLGLNN